MASNLRSKTEIFLIGFENSQICGAKLPTTRHLLQTFFYNHRTLKFSLKTSAELVIKEVLIFWEKARIKTRQDYHCVQKLLNVHTSWNTLNKNKNRTTETQKNYEKNFVETLDQLFDIAHADALNLLKGEDKEFLINQRKPEREGCLTGVDVKANATEKRRAERKEKEYLRKKKYVEECERSKNGKTI